MESIDEIVNNNDSKQTMIKTYIYGTPHGFDLYEDGSGLQKYFEQFYISSRKGRRLMIHRPGNGVTTYNYLRYGISEAQGRPNAFFGMTMMTEDNEYVSDVKKLLEWCDFIFNKVVEQGTLFQRNANGVVQYIRPAFKNAAEGANWIKTNLPKIVNNGSIALKRYDASFRTGNNARMAGLNPQESADIIAGALRAFPWVTLSDEYELHKMAEELNLPELSERHKEISAELLPIISGVKSDNALLQSRLQELKVTHEQLKEYMQQSQGSVREQCTQLAVKYDELVKICGSKVGVQPHSTTTQGRHASAPNVQRKMCTKCGQLKPISDFATMGDTVCRSCKNLAPKTRRRCQICGQVKPISAFTGNSEYCNTCRGKRNTKAKAGTKGMSRRTLALIAAAVVGVIVLIIAFSDKGADVDKVQQQVQTLLHRNQFQEAWEEAEKLSEDDNEVADSLKKQIHHQASEWLAQELFKQENEHKTSDMLKEFYTNNPDIADNDFKKTFNNVEEQYRKILRAIDNRNEKDAESTLILLEPLMEKPPFDSHSDVVEDLKHRIKRNNPPSTSPDFWDERSRINDDEPHPHRSGAGFTIKYTTPYGEQRVYDSEKDSKIFLPVKIGSTITVDCEDEYRYAGQTYRGTKTIKIVTPGEVLRIQGQGITLGEPPAKKPTTKPAKQPKAKQKPPQKQKKSGNNKNAANVSSA